MTETTTISVEEYRRGRGPGWRPTWSESRGRGRRRRHPARCTSSPRAIDAERPKQKQLYEGGLRGHHVAEGVRRPGAHPRPRARLPRGSRRRTCCPTSASPVAPLRGVRAVMLAHASDDFNAVISRGSSPATSSGVSSSRSRSPGPTSPGCRRVRPATATVDPQRRQGLELVGVLRRLGMCLARTNWDVPKHRGLTWFGVPVDARVTCADPPDQRRRRVLRGVLRRRRDPRRRAHRRRRSGLDGGADHAGLRAGRVGGGAPDTARAGSPRSRPGRRRPCRRTYRRPGGPAARRPWSQPRLPAPGPEPAHCEHDERCRDPTPGSPPTASSRTAPSMPNAPRSAWSSRAATHRVGRGGGPARRPRSLSSTAGSIRSPGAPTRCSATHQRAGARAPA